MPQKKPYQKTDSSISMCYSLLFYSLKFQTNQMKKPLLLSMFLCFVFATKSIAQTATTVSLNGTISTNTISNNVATAVDSALTITSDGTISGFTVQITGSYTSGDILAYTGSLPSGISAGAFNITSKSIQFTGITDAATWQAFLRTITIRTASATCYPEQRQVSFIAGDKFYNPLNGHYYQISPTQTSWQTGFTNAANSSYFGRQGYMLTITSAAENSFVTKILATDSWIGNTDDYSYINSALGNTTYANQSASEGKWYWSNGPEKGMQMTTANQVFISSVYESWGDGEPNNAGNENFGVINVEDGSWWDLNGTQGFYTIVEYGGLSTDITAANVVYTRKLAIAGAPSGTITGGNITVCSGTNSTTLTLSGLASGGTVARWEYSYDNFLSTQTTIANTTTSLTVNNISQNTYYRAVVNTSSCSNLGTSSTYINASAAVAGNIVADNNTICNGAFVNFILNGYSGSIDKWQVSTSSTFASGITDISNTTPAMSYQLNTAGTYYFRAVILSCSNTVYTNIYTVSAVAGTSPVGGTVSSANFCGGSNSGTLTLSGFTGSVSKWQFSTDGGVVWTNVANTTASLSYAAINGTRRYRAELTNGACGTALSTLGIITIYQASVGGTTSGAASVCAGTNSTTLSLSGNTGTIQWQSSPNNITFSNINGATSSSYTATNLSATTYYRAVVTNVVCTAVNSTTVTVTIKALSTSTTNISICPSGLPYMWNGSRTAAGTYTFTTTNSVGCDSTATLNLTVKSTSTTSLSICPSALPYSWNGLTFSGAGSQTAYISFDECDSLATLNLSILSISSSTTNASICPSALPYTWNGLTFNAAGSQTANLTNAAGCDSAATLNLTVKATSTSTTNISICPSALPYTWNGLTFNAAGSQTANLTNAAGCDSAATLDLTVKAISTSTDSVTICSNELPYNWNGNNFNASGTYNLIFTNSVGCDSAATLVLIVNAKPDAGADYTVECSNEMNDTLKGLPTTGTWVAMSSNIAGLNLSVTTSGNAIVTFAGAAQTGTYNFIYIVNGCSDTMSVNIGVSGNPTPAVNMGTNPICNGDTMQMCPTVWGWANYQWYKNGVAIAAPQGVSACLTLDSTGAGSYTLAATNGSGCWSVQSAPIVVTTTTCNTTCNAGLTAPCLSSSYACTGSPTTLVYDLTTIALTCSKPIGTILEWHTGNPATAANMEANPTAASLGSYWAVYKDTINNCYANNGYATQNVTIDTCSNSVTSGGGGGVESKTLGDVIAVRLYGNAINSTTQVDGLTNGIKFVKSGAIVNGANDLTLNILMPATIANTDAAYVSTPTDLVNFTNAVEVLAIDYAKAATTKAVAFGTKTLGDVYSHTKPICDRLKGAELLEVKNITVNGFSLMAYKVRQRTGEVEYAINLSAGTATNRSSISLQSNWFTNSYARDEKLYNFQLWAVSYEMVKAMAKDIVTKLQSNGTVNNVTNADLPKAYISKGSRKNTELNVTINNNTSNTTGYFELREKANENSTVTTRQIPFTIQPMNQTTIQLPVKDNYEGNIYVYLNNKLTDLVYLADGTWALDYNKATTIISKFNVTNETPNTLTPNANEHRLFRNVSVAATAKDYITVYKTMMGGGLEQNVSSFKSLLFTANATGASSVAVTLVKKSIIDWKDQYSYTVALDGNKEYGINLNQFKSAKYTDAINANDIIAVNFSFINSRGITSAMNINLSKARFASNTVATDVTAQMMSIYPNPTTGRFTVGFTSETATPLVLKVVALSTGKVVKTQFINATKGVNQTAVELNNTTSTNGLFIVTLEGDNIKYNAAKLMVNRK
jgi:hypothetical protein